MTMQNTVLEGDKLGKRDVLLAFLAGIGLFIAYLVFSPRGLDPALWNEMTVASGLRPPQMVFSGLWRFIALGLLSFCGREYVVDVLRIAGSAVGAVSVFFVYLILRIRK